MPDPLPRPARHVVTVASGKGGVGKSTVSLNVAVALAQTGARVGLLDADLYGPDIPLMVGIRQRVETRFWTLARSASDRSRQQLLPSIVRHGVRIMSAGLVLAEDQPMALDPLTVRHMAAQLVADVDWGVLDYLLVDLPPGTEDIQQKLLAALRPSGTVIVVTPTDAAHLDARKVVRMHRRAGITILGGVENMSRSVCPHCQQPLDIFVSVPHERSIWSMGVERLGMVPLSPEVSAAGDGGTPLLVGAPGSAAAQALGEVARQLMTRLAADPASE